MPPSSNTGPSRGKRVSLRELVTEVEAVWSEWQVSVNLETGEVVDYPGPDAFVDGELEPEEDYEEPPWCSVPLCEADEEWRIMRDFAESRDQAAHRQSLIDAVQGSHPFRRVRETIRRLGIEQAWHPFRRAAIAVHLRRWLDLHEIPYVDDED